MVAGVTSQLMESGFTEPSNFAAGWYPDPTHRFEFRYYNGDRWTADVAHNSIRYVDQLASGPPTFGAAPPSRAMAVTALVFSIGALVIAWLPFLFALAAVGAIAAVIMGTVVLRRSARNSASGQTVAIGQGMAIGAICTSVAALALCIVGFHLTQVVLREVDKLVNPGPHEVRIDRCARDGGHLVAEGSIRNDDSKTHGYTITITFRLDGDPWETDTVRVIDVGAGDRAEFKRSSDSVDFTSAPVTCTIDQVYGPPPFSD